MLVSESQMGQNVGKEFKVLNPVAKKKRLRTLACAIKLVKIVMYNPGKRNQLKVTRVGLIAGGSQKGVLVV